MPLTASSRSLLAPPRAPAPPKAAEDGYRRRLRALVGGAIERAYRPLLTAIPLLVGAMQAQAGGTRQDASPVDDAARMVRDGQGAFGSSFAKEARAAGGVAARNIASHTKMKLRRQLDEAPDRRINAIKLTDSPKLKPLIDGFVAENVALINGISPRLAADVQGLVVQGLTNGVPAARLAEQIRARMNISTQRAELIAIDQIGKLDGKLTEQRHRDIGVTHFFWRSSNDERVRGNPDGKYPKATPSHWERNGKRFAYADPPRGRNGEAELPGTPVRCRCWQEPDLSTLIGASAPANEEAASTEQPPAAAPDIDALEAEASRMMAEVEAMLQRQQAEIERVQREQESEIARREAEKLPDPRQEAQAKGLEMQLRMADPIVTETAVARHRRWKRAGARGDSTRADYDPNQPRAPDGRFGEVAGSHEKKGEVSSPAPADAPPSGKSREERARLRNQERVARVEAIRRASMQRGRMMKPSQWQGWANEAERDMDNARYEMEAATDDLAEAGDDKERAAARERISLSRSQLEDAEGRWRGFSDLIENQALEERSSAPDDDDDEESDEGTSAPSAPKYPELSSISLARYEKEIAAIDAESKKGFAKDRHPAVTFKKQEWAGRRIATDSVGQGIPVEELTHAFAPPDGYTAIVDDVKDGKFSMAYYKDGKHVGDIVREFRPGGEVHHSYLVLTGDAQGGGFADTVNGQALLRYEKLGIKKVTVDAAWVGRYKWATMGFRFSPTEGDVGSGRQSVEAAIEAFFERRGVEEKVREQVRGLIDRPWELAKLADENWYEVEFKSGPNPSDRSSGEFDIGKALFLQGGMPVWAGVMDIDRNNEGYLHALSKLKVETRK